MAQYLARRLRQDLDSAPAGSPAREPFRYRDKGTLATIGRSAGVGLIAGRKFEGFLAWLGWLFIHLVFLIGFRNRLAVFISWTYSYFTYKLGARIITGWPESLTRQAAGEQPPAANTGTDKNLVWR
jgi:NADH dehydrogenase